MNCRMTHWLLKCYPVKWQAEYGGELEDLLAQRPLSVGIVRNVLWSAAKERARQPFAHALLGSGLVFFFAVVFSHQLWHVVGAPVGEVLRSQGIRPPNLVSLTPWEQLEVIYLRLPLLITALLGYPCSLLLVWRTLTKKARTFAGWSAAFYVIAFFAGTLAWQNGSVAILLHVMPDVQNAPMVSISHCFNLFTASTLGPALLFQIPIVASYKITRAIQKTHRT